MAYWEFKDLASRIASHKVLRDKAFKIAKNTKYDGYQRGLASTFLITSLEVVVLNLCQINILQMSIIKQLLKNRRRKKKNIFII